MSAGQTEVVIIGGGPVGLALALDLGQRGVDVVLLEQGQAEARQPRMDLVGVRTMEMCRQWGIVHEVETAGFDRDAPQDIAYVSGVFGEEYCRDTRPSMRLERPPPFSPQKRERCPQNFFDPVLRRAAERCPSVTLRFGARGQELRQHAGGIEVDYISNGDRPTTLAAS